MSGTDCAPLRGVTSRHTIAMERLRAAPWVAALMACLLGCATVPKAAPEESAKAREMAVPEGKALVYVFRAGLVAAMSTLPLYANQEFIGEIAASTFYVLETAPGDLRLDFPFGNGGASLDLKVEAGRRYYVSQYVELTYVVLVKIHKPMLIQVDAEEGAASLGSLVRVVKLAPHQDEDRLARERQPPPDRALVFVYRSLWLSTDVEVSVLVNGQEVGKEPARSFLVAEVAPGKATLVARTGGQATLQLDLQAGATAYVELVPKAGFFGSNPELKQVTAERGRLALAGLRLAPHAGP
jgi:hypothetical protein